MMVLRWGMLARTGGPGPPPNRVLARTARSTVERASDRAGGLAVSSDRMAAGRVGEVDGRRPPRAPPLPRRTPPVMPGSLDGLRTGGVGVGRETVPGSDAGNRCGRVGCGPKPATSSETCSPTAATPAADASARARRDEATPSEFAARTGGSRVRPAGREDQGGGRASRFPLRTGAQGLGSAQQRNPSSLRDLAVRMCPWRLKHSCP